jgi:hypothetical protein
MKNKPHDLLKQIMEKPENISMDQMDDLVKNSLQFFSDYIDLAKSGDKEAQENALKELLDFKDCLESISQKSSEETGLSAPQLFEIMNNPQNFSKEQWDSMKEINESITKFNTTLLAEFLPNTKKTLPKAGRASKKQHISI